MVITKKQKEIFKKKEQNEKKNFISTIFNEGLLFVVFSFFACIYPIILSLLGSLVKPSGSQAVMAIGYLAPFFLSFIQISFSMTLIVFYKLKQKIISKQTKYNQNNVLYSNLIWMSVYIGIVMIILYIISSYLYIHFSTNRPNTYLTLEFGYDYIWTSCISVFLSSIRIALLFIIFRHSRKKALFFEFFNFLLISILPLALVLFTNLKVYGIGIGVTIGILVSILITLAYIKINYSYKLYSPKKMFIFTKMILILSTKESLTFISLSIVKGVAIFCLSIAIPITIKDFVPLSYQMSRVLWFNMMYFIPFLGIGIGEAIRAHYLSSHGEINTCNAIHSKKYDIIIVSFTLLITASICVGGIYLIKPLTKVYIVHDYNPFLNDRMPILEGFGTLAPLPNVDKLNLVNFGNELKKLSTLGPNEQLKAIIIIKTAFGYLQKDNPEITQWLNQNVGGQTLINFMFNNPQVSLKYFVYLKLYSSIDADVVNSFLNLREMFPINQNNTSAEVYLFLTYIQTFNAKSMIYICIFSLLNSVWAIWLQTSARNSGKEFPHILMFLVYVFAIGGLVTFGVIFGVTYNNETWDPFRYLDAWTFPLIVISTLAIIVVGIRNSLSYKSIKKEKQALVSLSNA